MPVLPGRFASAGKRHPRKHHLHPAAWAKNNKGEHIIIHQDLEALIQEHSLRGYPKDYYIFTADQRLNEVPDGVNYFYKRHKKLLEELRLTDESCNCYGYKHTGAVNLYNATKA